MKNKTMKDHNKSLKKLIKKPPKKKSSKISYGKTTKFAKK